MNPVAHADSPSAYCAARAGFSLSLQSRVSALGARPHCRRSEPSASARPPSLKMRTPSSAIASSPSGASRCSSTSRRLAPGRALSWPAKALGADTTLVSSLSSSIEKGESLKDTGLTLRALGAEAIILRHNSSGAAWLLEESTRLPVVNAGDGMHEHPTQALLDLRTILSHLRPGIGEVDEKTLAGVTVMHRRRHSAQPRCALEHAAAAAARRACAALRTQGVAAGAGRTVGPGIEIERDFDAALRAVAGGDDAAHPGGEAGRAATRS